MTTPVGSTLGRPSVQDVALLLRARTKDSNGAEVGTFDDETRPTADQVELQIDAAMALVCTRFPPLKDLDETWLPAVTSLVAYRAALRIEKSYFPEQVRSDRSAYVQLREEYVDDLAALEEAIENAAGGASAGPAPEIASLPVSSWTSIRYTGFPWNTPLEQTDPALFT